MLLSTILKFGSIGWVGSVILIGLLINGDKLYSWVGRKVLEERDGMATKLDLMFIEISHEKLFKLYVLFLIGCFALGVFFLWPSVGGGFSFGIFFTLLCWRMPGKVIHQ